jgi:hypothetical protein
MAPGAQAGGPGHREAAEHRQALSNAESAFRRKAPDFRSAGELDPWAAVGNAHRRPPAKSASSANSILLMHRPKARKG